MEFFPDGHHVRLRSRVTGKYLHADEDGVGVSQRGGRRASLNTTWAVHHVENHGITCVLLHSAAHGRYLALAPTPSQQGYRVVLRGYDEPALTDVMWVGVRVPSGARDYVFLRHATYHHLRATGMFQRWHSAVTIDFYNWTNMTHWIVEAIPPRPAPPVLPVPGPTQSLGGRRGLFRRLAEAVVERPRIIRCFGEDDHGNFVQLGTFQFFGRSVFNLRNDVAFLMRQQNFTDITLCARAGFHGRLTPLVIDLPCTEDPIDIVVLTIESPAATALRYPDVDAA